MAECAFEEWWWVCSDNYKKWTIISLQQSASGVIGMDSLWEYYTINNKNKWKQSEETIKL